MSKKKKTAPASKDQTSPAVPEPVSEVNQPSAIAWWEHSWVGYLAAVIAAVLAYHGAVSNGYVFFDDDKAILYNEALRQPSIKGFFSGQNLGMYAPLTWIAYWIGIQLSGQEAWGHHLISLLLHAGNAVLVFAVLHQLFRRQWPALFAAVLFAAHPVQAEAVSWAAATSTVLFAFFYLSALLAYIRWSRTTTPLLLPLSIVLFLLACLSKSAAVTLPLVLVAVDFYMNKKMSGKLWMSKTPYFLISLIFGYYTFSTRAQEGHDIELASSLYSALDRFWMICQTLWFYPVKLLAPFSFSIAYPFVKTAEGWPWTYYAAAPALLLSGWLVWRYWRNQPEYLVSLSLYLLPLAVMLPFRTVGSFELRSDRYVYLSCIGIFLIIGLLLEKYTQSAVRYAALVILGAGLAVLGYQQSQVWKDGISLFENCVEKTPDAALCQCNLAYNELLRMDFQGAVRHYSETLRLDETYIEAYNGRGQANFQLKQIAPALEDFTRAIEFGLSSPKLFLNRGKCLVMLNRPQEAIPDLSKSLDLESRSPEAYFFRGFAYEKTGSPDLAIQDYSKAIEQQPNYLEPVVNRGLLYANNKEYEAALADYTRALELNPDLPMALNNRANVYLNLGRPNEALIDLDRAVERAPGYYRAYESRARAWQMLGRVDKATSDMATAQRIRDGG